MTNSEAMAQVFAAQTRALLYNLQPDVIADKKARQQQIENCPHVEWEQDMGRRIPFCKITGEYCSDQCKYVMKCGEVGMTDREKIIKGLECCTNVKWKCASCPYYNDGVAFPECARELRIDALELLKAKDTNVPTKWISVKDRLPDKDIQVLVCDIHKGQYTTAYNGEGQWDDEGYQYSCGPDIIEYWMPLPEPPKEGEVE